MENKRPQLQITILENHTIRDHTIYGYSAQVRGMGFDFNKFSTDFEGILLSIVKKLLDKTA